MFLLEYFALLNFESPWYRFSDQVRHNTKRFQSQSTFEYSILNDFLSIPRIIKAIKFEMQQFMSVIQLIVVSLSKPMKIFDKNL